MSISTDQLRALARQAGFRTGLWDFGYQQPPSGPNPGIHHFIDHAGSDLGPSLEIFARLVAQAERQRCLQAIAQADDGDQPAYRHCEEVIRALV
jgi:hypothetical protein